MQDVCLGGVGGRHGVCGSQEDNLGSVVPSLHQVCPRVWTEVGGRDSQCLYLLSYLTGQRSDTFFKYFTYWFLNLRIRGRRKHSKFNATFDFMIPNKEKQCLPFRVCHRDRFPWARAAMASMASGRQRLEHSLPALQRTPDSLSLEHAKWKRIMTVAATHNLNGKE